MTAAVRDFEALAGHNFGKTGPEIRTFERDVENGARGCYASHMDVFRDALATDVQAVLMLEDNLAQVGLPDEFVGQGPALLTRQLAWAARSQGHWDILHLALVHSAASLCLVPVEDEPIARVERTAPDVYGVVPIEKAPGLGTTAYVISRRAMDRLLTIDAERGGYAGVPIDDLLAETFPATTFAAWPVLWHRGLAPSFVNPGQGAFRNVMYDPRAIRLVERALVSTGISSSGLVCCLLSALAFWTVAVVIPVSRELMRVW